MHSLRKVQIKVTFSQHNFIFIKNKDTFSAKNDYLSSGMITRKTGAYLQMYTPFCVLVIIPDDSNYFCPKT